MAQLELHVPRPLRVATLVGSRSLVIGVRAAPALGAPMLGGILTGLQDAAVSLFPHGGQGRARRNAWSASRQATRAVREAAEAASSLAGAGDVQRFAAAR